MGLSCRKAPAATIPCTLSCVPVATGGTRGEWISFGIGGLRCCSRQPYSRPCKERKDGASEILVWERRSKPLKGSATRLATSTGILTNSFRYTAHEFDTETGIYEYRARYYDQNVGRFLSEDPKRLSGGPNFYDYVRNNSVNFRDPSGEIPVWGWWCGPNWTGGTFAPYDPSQKAHYHKPWGDTDRACMNHDICYYNCRRDHPCSKNDRAQCMRKCDSVLLAMAPYSVVGNVVSEAVWLGNKNPDAGENEDKCPCKEKPPPPAPFPPCHGWQCIDNK